MKYQPKRAEPKAFAEATDETIAAYAIDLIDLDSQSDEIQASRKRTYEDARDTYGKKFARSLKRAVALHRMDADKRTEADEIDAEAERFLEIIRKPSAPRATRSANTVPHDPETGEITEPPAINHGGDHEYQGVAKIPNSSTEAAKPLGLSAAVIANDDTAAGAGSRAGGSSVVPASVVEPDAPIPEPETVVPPAVSEAGDESAVSSPAALVVPADRSKPHPWCKDPAECGVEASWNHMCLSCHRRMEKALTERASSVLQ